MDRPWVICDIDGVIADARHRSYYLVSSPKKTDWESYTKMAFFDPPIVKMCLLIKHLSKASNIAFVTGRARYAERLTRDWIIKYVGIGSFELHMRPENDSCAAATLKQRVFSDHFMSAKRLVWCVFEDDGRVVDMYRSLGLLVLQPEDRRAGS